MVPTVSVGTHPGTLPRSVTQSVTDCDSFAGTASDTISAILPAYPSLESQIKNKLHGMNIALNLNLSLKNTTPFHAYFNPQSDNRQTADP